jgi:ferredoxin-NADP reductase/nitroimidazol reductase NimA-like FMN-containing flavoprotein (pyridoxamine 5'-phosphate oxidase superfamily)
MCSFQIREKERCMPEEFEVTERSRVSLFGNRGSHRKDDIYTAIDGSLYGMVAYSIADQPYATPTMIWRRGDYIYWHGSAGSRMLKTVAAGCNVSVTFVHVDGFVLSRLASAHAMNYRSVMVFGNAEPVESLQERRDQLEFFLSRLFPGRWEEVKQPSPDELKGIIMVRMRIQEGSLKRRAGLPADGRAVFGGEKLFEQACWAGTLPIEECVGFAEDANRLKERIELPAYISNFAQRFGRGTRADSRPGYIRAEVVEIRQIAKAVKLFKLRPRAGRFPKAEAGAHLKIGVVLTDRTRDFRQYTIVDSDPDGAWYEIAVLREANGRGGSLYMHEEIDLRATVSVIPPENDFPLDRSATHSVLVAGGIGITPIFAMVRELQSLGRSAELHYSAKGIEHAAFLDELRNYTSLRTSFYDTSSGSDHRMNLEMVLGPVEQGRHIYVCGPHRLIADTFLAAERLGYAPEVLHSETFAPPASLSTDLPIEINLARTGKSFTVSPGHSILDVALSEGIEVSHSCKRGECGLCATMVVEGDPDHRDRFLSAGAKGEGKMCICVSWARSSSLVLDL